jgi:hypothetical protein
LFSVTMVWCLTALSLQHQAKRREDEAVTRLHEAADAVQQALARASGAGALEAALKEASVSRALTNEQERAVTRRVLYHLSLQSGAAPFEEAKAAGLPHLPPFPRSARRFANRVRVHLYLCTVRGILQPHGPATAQEVGLWCGLQERWPELGHALLRVPEALEALRDDAGTPGQFQARMATLAPIHANDEALREFLRDQALPNVKALAWLDLDVAQERPVRVAA